MLQGCLVWHTKCDDGEENCWWKQTNQRLFWILSYLNKSKMLFIYLLHHLFSSILIAKDIWLYLVIKIAFCFDFCSIICGKMPFFTWIVLVSDSFMALLQTEISQRLFYVWNQIQTFRDLRGWILVTCWFLLHLTFWIWVKHLSRMDCLGIGYILLIQSR